MEFTACSFWQRGYHQSSKQVINNSSDKPWWRSRLVPNAAGAPDTTLQQLLLTLSPSPLMTVAQQPNAPHPSGHGRVHLAAVSPTCLPGQR